MTPNNIEEGGSIRYREINIEGAMDVSGEIICCITDGLAKEGDAEDIALRNGFLL